MKDDKYTGISFPFRLNQKGGVATSTTSPYDPRHIEEGLIQLLSTKKFERVMEPSVGSTVGRYVLNYQDTALYNMIKYEVIKVLTEQEPRITIDENSTRVYGEENSIVIDLHYTINKYNETFVTRVQM